MKKKVLIYSMFSICLVMMIGLVIAYTQTNISTSEKTSLGDYDYVMDIFKNTLQEVNNESEVTIIRPYTEKNVNIVRDFYDYRDDEKDQQKSIIYYDGTYMQSTGISYGAKDSFDVVAILSGEVTEVVTDELVGNSITIKHNDNTYSVYQSITDINVKKGDYVKQGDKLAITGTCNMSKDLNNHLYFELIIDGVSVNPEEYYDKAL